MTLSSSGHEVIEGAFVIAGGMVNIGKVVVMIVVVAVATVVVRKSSGSGSSSGSGGFVKESVP